MYRRLDNIKNEKMFKLWDISVGVIVLGIIISAMIMYFMPRGSYAEVYVNGVLRDRYPLSVDTTIEINDFGRNIIVIKDGQVYMSEASCESQNCVLEKSIHKVGDQIVCLPNKVIVIIVGKKEGELDAIT
ncbi:MAG: NusG domain II-containing protein [Clostridia bacterium]